MNDAEILDELDTRLATAARHLEGLAKTFPEQSTRLDAKVAGVALALRYLRDLRK